MGQPTAAVEAGRGERGRGRGRGEGGPPVWGIVGAPAPQVLCVEAPADVLWGAVGEGSRRYSTGNNTIYPIALVGWQVIQAGKIQLRVVQLPILYFLCCVLGVQGEGREWNPRLPLSSSWG